MANTKAIVMTHSLRRYQFTKLIIACTMSLISVFYTSVFGLQPCKLNIARALSPIEPTFGRLLPVRSVELNMTREVARRIAGNMVREFGKEQHFALSLPSREALDLIAESLKTDHGCTVVFQGETNKIAVRVPLKECVLASS